jgi:hypothetical protein
MSFITDHRKKFDDLRYYLDANDWSLIQQQANGGRSILLAYPPEEEDLYLEEAVKRLSDIAAFVEVNHLLVQYIDSMGWEEFQTYYQDYAATPSLVFKSDGEEADLLDLIISKLQDIERQGRVPVLLRAGCLYGTGIENAMIMEHPAIMAFRQPLVILYPATLNEQKELKFLGFKNASRYRCVLI